MNLRDIETLVDLVHVARVAEVTVRANGRRVTIRKDPHAPPQKQAPVEVVRDPGTLHPIPSEPPATALSIGNQIAAPMVGVFHALDNPLSVGSEVDSGQVIGFIESMRLMNEVVTESGGMVGAIFVEDGMAVEYGQAILRIDPLPGDDEGLAEP